MLSLIGIDKFPATALDSCIANRSLAISIRRVSLGVSLLKNHFIIRYCPGTLPLGQSFRISNSPSPAAGYVSNVTFNPAIEAIGFHFLLLLSRPLNCLSSLHALMFCQYTNLDEGRRGGWEIGLRANRSGSRMHQLCIIICYLCSPFDIRSFRRFPRSL
jgi:hypothetical protein